MVQSMGSGGAKQRITLERQYKASVEEVWELWTTKEGIEEWWGPDGFSVTVHQLELRAGGAFEYAMTATDPPQIEFMKKAGMPTTTQHRGTFTEVVPPTRLAFIFPADFMPGVASYPVATTVDLAATAAGVRLLLTIDPMHDAHWTDMAVKGWEMELGRLEHALAKRA
jgi:uncharacterized protein YndB with AHSA1/START domain